MDITNFSGSIRIGGNFPSTIDVSPIEKNIHETSGVLATCYMYGTEREKGYTQFRQDKKRYRLGLFVFSHTEMEVPEDWKDSTVIWDSRTTAP